MATNILIFKMVEFEDFNTNTLIGLGLKTLLGLSFYKCSRIVVTKQSFAELPTLKSLTFGDSTVESIEKGANESLPNLVHFALESSFGKKNSWSEEKKAHLRRFHWQKDYQWFRAFLLNKRPDLVKPRRKGEVISMSGAVSPPVA